MGLKQEASNIACSILKNREMQRRNKQNENWKPSEIEPFGRTFNESSRYYNLFDFQKKHGVKYIPPPKAENM